MDHVISSLALGVATASLNAEQCPGCGYSSRLSSVLLNWQSTVQAQNSELHYLAAHLRACHVQSGMPASPVAVHAGASLPGRRLLPHVCQHSMLSAVG